MEEKTLDLTKKELESMTVLELEELKENQNEFWFKFIQLIINKKKKTLYQKGEMTVLDTNDKDEIIKLINTFIKENLDRTYWKLFLDKYCEVFGIKDKRKIEAHLCGDFDITLYW